MIPQATGKKIKGCTHAYDYAALIVPTVHRHPHDEDFHDLVAERYERTATVITSNLDFGEWGDAFPNQLLGAATLDRLRHGAYRVVLDGKSYRSPRPMENQLENKQKVSK